MNYKIGDKLIVIKDIAETIYEKGMVCEVIPFGNIIHIAINQKWSNGKTTNEELQEDYVRVKILYKLENGLRKTTEGINQAYYMKKEYARLLTFKEQVNY